MPFYRLQDRVGCCRSADRLVFLDLNADRYFCLGGKLEQAFAALLDDQPADATAVAALLHAGVIVSADEGRPMMCTTLPASDALLCEASAPLGTVLKALAHRAKWSIRLKTRTLAANVDWLLDRRALVGTRRRGQI